MFIVSLYDRESGTPVRTAGAETYIEAEELRFQFQAVALDGGYGVIITEGYFSTSQGESQGED
ncbi:MAG: hypothetical protein EBR81_11750 [Proteobacteria bacterium]|nr:hypothetical protein [Pseudomonadota bacterium]